MREMPRPGLKNEFSKHIAKSFLIPVVVLFSLSSRAQETTSFGFGYNFVKKQPVIDLLFNRTSATYAEDQYDIKLIKKGFVLNPAAEVHFGEGNETSEDNIILNLNTYYKHMIYQANDKRLWKSLYKLYLLSPQFNSDKDFGVYQALAMVGIDFTRYYSRRDRMGYLEYTLGSYFDYGLSHPDSQESDRISRMRFRPSFQWQFWGRKSDSETPPELDPAFYYRVDLRLAYVHYLFFAQDERTTTNRSFGYFSAVGGYKINKSVKMTVAYKTGMVEPNFTNLNSFSIGFALTN